MIESFILPIVTGVLVMIIGTFSIKYLEKERNQKLLIKQKLPRILGLLSIVIWVLPIIGIVVAVIGLIYSILTLMKAENFGNYKYNRLSIILNLIGLIASSFLTGFVCSQLVLSYRNQTEKPAINILSKDIPTLQICNFSKTSKFLNPMTPNYWSFGKEIELGDTISFEVSYHNSGYRTLRDVRIKLSFIFYSNFVLASASVGELNSSNITAGVSFGWMKNYNGDPFNLRPISSNWAPHNSNEHLSEPFPFHQNGMEIFSFHGLRIGDLQSGSEAYQGTIKITLVVEAGGKG